MFCIVFLFLLEFIKQGIKQSEVVVTALEEFAVNGEVHI